MKELKQYIHDILGLEVDYEPFPKQVMSNLPMFIGETYQLYDIVMFDTSFVLVEPKNKEYLSILQTEKHFSLLKKALHKKMILIMQELTSYNRKRLIDKGINFIVTGKQFYMPDLLIDLRESFTHFREKEKDENLLPSSQFILIYHIIHRFSEWKVEEHSFKELAEKIGYTAMAISKAIENLKYHALIEVVGSKEKFIRFKLDRAEMWRDLAQRKLWINPVIKRVFVDKKPKDVFMLLSNTSALAEYSNMNSSRQAFYAIDKNAFHHLQKNKALVNANAYEGEYCLEVWKYNPVTLVGEMPNDIAVVDPLSLYLSLMDSHDERIEMTLIQIIEKFIW